MPKHSMTLCWLHLIWSTKSRYPFFNPNDKAIKCLDFIKEICSENNIYFKIGYINPEHVHLLEDLPVDISIKKMMQLLKGISSHKINDTEMFIDKFSWARGYAAFSVSQNGISDVVNYIKNQKEHHKKETFRSEWEKFIRKYELVAFERN